MKRKVTPVCTSVACALLGLLLIAAAPDEKSGGGGKGRGAGPGGQVEPAVVPPYLFNVWLCRPGADSVTVSVLAWEDMEGFIEYGPGPQRTEVMRLKSGEPQTVVLHGLQPDTAYDYRFAYRRGGGEMVRDVVRSFHTQRRPGSNFTFVMQADSHLDMSTDVRVYQQTLANMLADKPDFLVDLGDTTMVDKFGSFYTRASSQYLAQRFYLGRVAHSVPVFFTLGNHDGEKGERPEMAVWSLGMRKKFFPNPEPGGIYTGNGTLFENAGLLQNYYAWEWGGALFVVLDPFWSTTSRGGEDNWGATLGEAQYRWLTHTLEGSRAPFKFVFIHHLAGGLGKDARGGAGIAPYMEWGGKNADGSEGFAARRPGWPLPIHALMVKHGVSAVFHGHDHLYVPEDLDGITYQEVPQPGHPSGGTRSAEEYGYKGTVRGSSGHLRVIVKPGEARVEYVRSIVPGVTRDEIPNGNVEHSYSLKPFLRR
ncbi:metallophosphoesterase family protein [Prosthecobacter sp.]|uniref:metallophosphoesterase family protein n=1 Tax=Prosthecobacter sp. TaxID=1965333 RepID=UPI003782D7ED